MKGRRKTYLSPEETAMFCEQVALILRSGIPLYDGIETLCETYRDTRYGDRFVQLEEKMKETGSLYEAVEAVGIFPPYMVASVKIGEAAGTAEQVMASLASYYQREAQIRKSVRSAVTYPMVLVAMMAAVILVLVVRVLPIFRQVFRNMGTSMSESATAVMNFGLAAGTVVLALVGLLIVAAAVILILLRTGARERTLAFLERLIPAFRDIRRKTTAGRFSSVMAMMSQSGFPLEEGLALAPQVMDDPGARAQVEACREAMAQGESFPDAVSKSGIYDGLQDKMIRVGYMAGQMDTVMAKLAEIYEEELDDSIRRLVAFIEPTLVAVLSIIIGAVLLAVMLPLASILSSMS